MNLLAINTVGTELENAASFCRSENIGMEITHFAFPQNLDSDLTAQIARHKDVTSGIEPLSSHGPFMDLLAHSPDPTIVEAVKRRHVSALNASHAVGASYYVAHTNYNPMIGTKSYRDGFARRICDFWLPFADWAAERSIVICLENLWEPDSTIQNEIITLAAHPNLRASFDNGHALVFSEKPSAEWVKELGGGLAHCHLHDNQGHRDEHSTVGSGMESWGTLLSAINSFAPEALLVVECDSLGKNTESLRRIRGFQQTNARDGVYAARDR